MTSPHDPAVRAAQALRAGDAATAQAILADAKQERALTRSEHWLLAQTCRRLEDAAGEKAALLAILRDVPRDMPALLAMGDVAMRDGDDRAAVSWFTTALRQAAVTPPPTALHPLLQRAQTFCTEAQTRFATHLIDALADVAIDTQRMPAVAHPSMFYYPGLPQRAFYERDEFDWVAGMEAQSAVLRDEFLAANTGAFAPYIERSDNRPASANHLLEDPSWSAAYLWRYGTITDLAALCPATMAALAQAPQPVIEQRSPMALWSRITPGTHIRPHHGLLNTRLICHLPLVPAEGCGLRVGHETREWRFGEMLIFDDSIEHEAWNRGTGGRTVLLFEIWRPEIPVEERHVLTRLFTAIDAVDPARGEEVAA
jgi:aspartyl/asparaginyl beta-hydroxylase (cupin superfamily)